jgi:hypothetical protein
MLSSYLKAIVGMIFLFFLGCAKKDYDHKDLVSARKYSNEILRFPIGEESQLKLKLNKSNPAIRDTFFSSQAEWRYYLSADGRGFWIQKYYNSREVFIFRVDLDTMKAYAYLDRDDGRNSRIDYFRIERSHGGELFKIGDDILKNENH